MSHFSYEQKVLFRHCDPAGIMFFPRGCEMVNDATEALFAGPIGWPFEKMHPEAGMPTVSLNMEFHHPVHHGEVLNLDQTIERIGTSSMELKTVASALEEPRFTATQVVVMIGADKRAMPWPDEIRQRMNELRKEGQ